MNGEVFDSGQVRKNVAANRFERLQAGTGAAATDAV